MYEGIENKQIQWWLLTAVAVTFFIFFSQHVQKVTLPDNLEIQEEQEVQPIDDLVFMAYEFPSIPSTLQSTKTASNQANSVKPLHSDASYMKEQGAQTTEVESNATSEFKQNDFRQENVASDIDAEDLKAVNMTIKMPSNSGKFYTLGKFLYQCVNIGFGYIESQQNGVVQVIRATDAPHSQIFRRTQHALFANESHWRSVYGASNQFVRIYPAWLDKNLITHINQNLNGEQITSLSARYSLQNNLLQLIDITLNGRPLVKAWTLANGYDLGCR